MATKSILTIDGTDYEIKDASARNTANAASTAQEYDRQQLVSAYAGRSLASTFAAEVASKANVWAWLQSRVKAANFSGLRIGDYIDVPIIAAAHVSTQTARYRIGAIDPYYLCGDTKKGHHIAMVPSAPVLVSGEINTSCLQWAATDNNNGTAEVKTPYLGSKLHDWEINDFLPALPAEVQAVLMTQLVILEERYASAGGLTEASGWSWQDIGKVWSLSEMEVYGCPVWGSRGYSVGIDCQFPIFSDTAARIMGSRVNWWLRSVAGGSASSVCCVSDSGNASYRAPTGGTVRPRPCFLVG